jgi:hypothetical protein
MGIVTALSFTQFTHCPVLTRRAFFRGFAAARIWSQSGNTPAILDSTYE